MSKPKSLAEFIERNDVIQAALARQLNISPSYLNDIKAGRRTPSLKLAMKISGVTGLPVSALVAA